MGMMVYSLLWGNAGFLSSTVGRPLEHVTGSYLRILFGGFEATNLVWDSWLRIRSCGFRVLTCGVSLQIYQGFS